MDKIYPTQEIYDIVAVFSEKTGLSPFVIMEAYGEFLVPDLLLIYNKYIQPEWTTYEMIVNIEKTFHGAVKKQDNRTSPPILSVQKEGKNQLLITYFSKRKMAAVALGIIKGIAKYYQKSDQVQVVLLTPIDGEKVEIRVVFSNATT